MRFPVKHWWMEEHDASRHPLLQHAVEMAHMRCRNLDQAHDDANWAVAEIKRVKEELAKCPGPVLAALANMVPTKPGYCSTLVRDTLAEWNTEQDTLQMSRAEARAAPEPPSRVPAATPLPKRAPHFPPSRQGRFHGLGGGVAPPGEETPRVPQRSFLFPKRGGCWRPRPPRPQ